MSLEEAYSNWEQVLVEERLAFRRYLRSNLLEIMQAKERWETLRTARTKAAAALAFHHEAGV